MCWCKDKYACDKGRKEGCFRIGKEPTNKAKQNKTKQGQHTYIYIACHRQPFPNQIDGILDPHSTLNFYVICMTPLISFPPEMGNAKHGPF
jgi:hypothetical protein